MPVDDPAAAPVTDPVAPPVADPVGPSTFTPFLLRRSLATNNLGPVRPLKPLAAPVAEGRRQVDKNPLKIPKGIPS